MSYDHVSLECSKTKKVLWTMKKNKLYYEIMWGWGHMEESQEKTVPGQGKRTVVPGDLRRQIRVWKKSGKKGNKDNALVHSHEVKLNSVPRNLNPSRGGGRSKVNVQRPPG